jgi:hypothetical protein
MQLVRLRRRFEAIERRPAMRFRESVVYGVIEIAQAVITEAEPHRRRFPNFAVAFTCAAMAISGHTPASGPVRGRALRRRHGLGPFLSDNPAASGLGSPILGRNHVAHARVRLETILLRNETGDDQ